MDNSFENFLRYAQTFREQLEPISHVEQLFSCLDNINYFGKDQAGRFVFMDDGFIQMLGCAQKEQVLGRNDFDFFPNHIAAGYRRDDESVMTTGRPLLHRTELVPNIDMTLDWWVVNKFPLYGKDGRVVGVAGVTSKLTHHNLPAIYDNDFYKIIKHISENYQKKICVTELARLLNLSARTFERHFIKAFNSTPHRYINNVRLHAACFALRKTGKTISEIALECGFCDHSYMTSIFKKYLGLTPQQYRLTTGKEKNSCWGEPS